MGLSSQKFMRVRLMRNVARKGEINAWDNPDFVAAVKAKGVKHLLLSGRSPVLAWHFPPSVQSMKVQGFRSRGCLGYLFIDGPGNHVCASC